MNLHPIKKWSIAMAFPLLLAACTTPNLSYMQDLENGKSVAVAAKTIKVQKGDKISIVVKSKDAQLSELFNLSIAGSRVGSYSRQNYSQQISCYTVASDGTVEIPVLGKVNVADKTREEIARDVEKQLLSKDLLKDAVVTVEFENLHYSVVGEVKSPGQYNIDRDQVSLLDALSSAGDLTIYGRRDNVMVIRQENGEQHIYRVDLTKGNELLDSPVCYLQQNDIVYVDPNDMRKRQATVNGNNVLSSSFWISIASLATSIAVLIFR